MPRVCWRCSRAGQQGEVHLPQDGVPEQLAILEVLSLAVTAASEHLAATKDRKMKELFPANMEVAVEPEEVLVSLFPPLPSSTSSPRWLCWGREGRRGSSSRASPRPSPSWRWV